jgi:protocatechuate 3,4-dioxygenase beta subunit
MFKTGYFSRRDLLKTSLAMGGVLLSSRLSPLLAQTPLLKPTAEQGMGPFYPVVKPDDQDADLTVIQGRPGTAKGQILHLRGRVFDLQGRAISGARVEIWQANAFGRYTHPGDTNAAPLDPHFEGYGVCTTDADGRYGFKTIKPAPYPAAQRWTRPPHIHFQVTSPVTRFVTQMYFPGEPLNEKDRLFNSAANKESLIARLTPADPADGGPDALLTEWHIVLPRT